MADTYNVSVTLDSFNGIITGNGDGTYNVTYTNLTNGQIDAIGAAIEKAVEDNLPEVALSGSYEDLDDIPENNEGKRQGFHEVAFTGEYSILEHKPDLKDLAFLNTVPYDKVDEAPSLINQPFIYDEENEQYTDEKAPFDRVAFTGNYEDLKNKPVLFDKTYDSLINAPGIPDEGYTDFNDKSTIKTFHEIAFTGNYNALSNKPEAMPTIQTFNIFQYSNNSLVQDIGKTTQIINNYSSLTTFLEPEKISSVNLKEQINQIIAMNNVGYIIYLIINNENTLVTEIINITDETGIIYSIFKLSPFLDSNINTTIQNNNTTPDIDDFTYIWKNRCIIFDNKHNCIYSLIENNT